MLFADLFDELGAKGLGALVGLIVGALVAWLVAVWRRRHLRQKILRGDARDTVVIHLHLVETSPDGKPARLRIRALGQEELSRVVPNDHLAQVFQDRAFRVTAKDTLISMEGPEGSYLLETLTGFVCDRVNNAPFEHDLYVMAPCCEPKELAEHQPIAILLISKKDLGHFADWPACRAIQVEHGGDGARILTLMAMARRFKSEQEALVKLRHAGQRTKFVETMYVLDLALDRRAVPLEVKEVPWGRFEDVLRQLNLE